MRHILYLTIILAALTSCHDIPDYPDNPKGNFEALWTTIDQHYCFFDEKGVDWQEVHDRYAPLITDRMSSQQLFRVCSDMINELHDGHTNLSAPFATSYYRKWWSDYPQNFNERIIQQYYFNFNYTQLGAFTYGTLPENIGYIRYSTFSSGIGAGNLDYLLQYFNSAQALIIDVRDNGGGNLTNVETLVSRFITERKLAGYIIHKNGPGHDDFDEPYAYYIDPAYGHIAWTKPVAVLTNRSTFSAANNFVSIMKSIPGVAIIGATTGGGSGMPFSSELPNGWGIRFSACSILDPDGKTTESGVEPTEGCAVDMDRFDEINGHDTILDFAIGYLRKEIQK